jgi:hypothetical protein
MRPKLLLALFALLIVSCEHGNRTQQSKETLMEKDSAIVFSNEDNHSGDYETGLKIYKKNGRVFLIDDSMPSSNGWTVRFLLIMTDTLTDESTEIGHLAAIHFEDDGFKAATARLVNPDAQCTADEEWVMHDEYYSYDGTLLRKDEKEYDYDEMCKTYGDSLVNAPIYRFGEGN